MGTLPRTKETSEKGGSLHQVIRTSQLPETLIVASAALRQSASTVQVVLQEEDKRSKPKYQVGIFPANKLVPAYPVSQALDFYCGIDYDQRGNKLNY